MSGHTPGPWSVHKGFPMYVVPADQAGRPIGAHTDLATDRTMFAHEIAICDRSANRIPKSQRKANARLIAAAPTQHEEMLRFLPIIERAEADPELWGRLTAGTGIATANGYRAAIKKATGAQA